MSLYTKTSECLTLMKPTLSRGSSSYLVPSGIGSGMLSAETSVMFADEPTAVIGNAYGFQGVALPDQHGSSNCYRKPRGAHALQHSSDQMS